MRRSIVIIASLALILTFAGCSKKCPHKYKEVEMQRDAYCDSDGYTGDITCLDCGEVLQAGEAIPAFGHDPETRTPMPATCTESGWSGETICKTCGEVLEEPVEVPAKGHTGDTYCKDCGILLENDK